MSDHRETRLPGNDVDVVATFVSDEPVPALMAHKILSVPDVESVYIQKIDDTFHVWTIVDAPDDSVLHASFASEKELIRRVQASGFDFNVIERRGRRLESIITLPGQRWTKDWRE